MFSGHTISFKITIQCISLNFILYSTLIDESLPRNKTKEMKIIIWVNSVQFTMMRHKQLLYINETILHVLYPTHKQHKQLFFQKLTELMHVSLL
jgi:hypothetical protein